jgi:hypothetical protein
MTTAKPLARYRAIEGALASGFVTAKLHHAAGHDRSASEGKPQRMSVYPVESQTLTPVPIGNGFTAAPPVRA